MSEEEERGFEEVRGFDGQALKMKSSPSCEPRLTQRLQVPLLEDSPFFNPANVEMVVKVLNGCGVNSRYWPFAGGLTDVNVILTVTDGLTGAVQTYTNPQGVPFQPIQDTTAFATCP